LYNKTAVLTYII